ncbi:NIP100 [Blepharisma stoltei]|uniref:CAP-Gly domain-containing protein n=1 Tax=Blepharisma stoltei TaxID=1481888 RepID=A0AAU9IXS6_9CILI|nr:unnamed protein product [Blepharisma stoltei]
MEPKRLEDRSSPPIKLGTRVVVTTQNSELTGELRYYGQLKGTTGNWYGINLDNPLGKNNGTLNGVKYFEANLNHGIFVRINQVKPIEEEEKKNKRAVTAFIGSGIRTTKKKADNPDDPEDVEEKTEEVEESALKQIREEAKAKIQEKKQIAEKKAKEELKKKEDTEDKKNPDIPVSTEEVKKLKADISEYKKQVESLKKASAESKEKDKIIDELTKKVKELESKTKGKKGAKEEVSLHEIIENLTLEKELAEENEKVLQKEIEELKEENEALKEEIELRNLEMEEIQSSQGGESSEVEVSQLKLALKKLYSDYQNSKAEYEERINLLENELGSLPNAEETQKQIVDLKSQLESKQADIDALNDALEESSGLNDMVENLTDTNLKLSEKIQNLEEQIQELQELHEMDEQITEEQAEIEKNLTNEIYNKEIEIQDLKIELQKLEAQRLDYEKTANQFRVKVCELQNDIQSLEDQLADTGEEEKMKKMQTLMERNTILINKIREMMGNHINGKISEIQNIILGRKITFVLEAIPDSILESMDLATFEKFSVLMCVKSKGILLVSELINETLDVPNERPLIRWISELSFQTVGIVIDLALIEEHLRKIPLNEYQELMKHIEWGQVLSISQSIDYYLKLIKEGGLSPSISLEPYILSLEAIHHFRAQNISLNPSRVSLARGTFLITVAIHNLIQMYGLDDSIAAAIDYKDLINKFNNITCKLLELSGDEDSQQMRNVGEILIARYNAVRQVLMDTEIIDYSSYNWNEFFIESDKDSRSIVLLNGYRKAEINEDKGSWSTITGQIKDRLANFEGTCKELEETKNSLKVSSIKLLKTEKEFNEMKIAKGNLEVRLADANAKSQRLAQLEIEKKRLQDREKYFEESLEAVNVEMEKLQEKNKQLEDEIKSLKEEDDEINKFRSNQSLVPTDTGGLINMWRGGSITRHGASAGQDEIETFRSVIDHYQLQHRQLNSSILRAQIRELPKLPQIPQNPLKSKLETIYSSQAKLKKEISKLRVIDLSDSMKEEKLLKSKETLDDLTYNARKALESITNFVTSESGGLGASAFNKDASQGTIGKITLGSGSEPVSVQVSLYEFQSIKKLLNLN